MTAVAGEGDEAVLTAADYGFIAVIGLLMVVAGGYVVAWMAKMRPLAHGVAVGVVVLLLSIVIELLARDPDAPLWFNIASFAGVVPAGALGGMISRKRTPATRGSSENY